MNDERIERALRELGSQRMAPAASSSVRSRIDEAWAQDGPRRGWSFPLRMLVPAATMALAIGLGGTALGAGADSPLWPARLALEEIGLQAQLSAEAQADYLVELIDSRTTEAAKQEATGNALAAGKALTAREAALQRLSAVANKVEPPRTAPPLPSALRTGEPTPRAATNFDATPTPEPTRTPDRTPEPTRSPEPTHTPDGTPPTPRTSPLAPTPTPRSEPTKTPLPPTTTKPAPTPTPTFATTVKVVGTVRYEDGTLPLKACITTSSNVLSATCSIFAENGQFTFSATLTPGVQIRLYAYATEKGLYSGSEAAIVTSPITALPTITLRPQAIPSPSASPSPTPTHTPTPTPTATIGTVTITGTVRFADGTAPIKACITTSSTLPTTCGGIFAENGVYSFTSTARPGMEIRLYAYVSETGTILSGSEAAIVTSPTTTLPPITVR